MTTRDNPTFKAIHVNRLCSEGWSWLRIAAVTDLPVVVCQRISRAPEWPKLVTRIGPDGSAELVRWRE